MPLWIWILAAWEAYRVFVKKESLLPAFLSDEFAKGAMLVKTETGHVVAVPLGTPIKDPLEAASDGDLNPDAASAIFASADQPAQVLMGGFGDPWNPDAGVGDDWEPGLYGLFRSTSISARRRV